MLLFTNFIALFLESAPWLILGLISRHAEGFCPYVMDAEATWWTWL